MNPAPKIALTRSGAGVHKFPEGGEGSPRRHRTRSFEPGTTPCLAAISFSNQAHADTKSTPTVLNLSNSSRYGRNLKRLRHLELIFNCQLTHAAAKFLLRCRFARDKILSP